MKIIRFGEPGKEKPGLLNNNKIIDLTKIFPDIPDITAEFFENGWLEKIAEVNEEGEELDVRLGPPVKAPSKILCIGKNYEEHAKEGNFENPEAPLVFSKAANALNGPYDDILYPATSNKVDWEVELAVVIGKQGKRIAPEKAFDYIAGYTIMNDVSARDVQFSDSQWFRGKSFDTFAPLGPALVTKDEVGDVHALRLKTIVDGKVMQDSDTGKLIFDAPEIIRYISQDITLMPGDVIATGTPSGVGIFRKPPILLSKGSIVECSIDKLGSIKNRVV